MGTVGAMPELQDLLDAAKKRDELRAAMNEWEMTLVGMTVV